jgi:hypothetical protein
MAASSVVKAGCPAAPWPLADGQRIQPRAVVAVTVRQQRLLSGADAPWELIRTVAILFEREPGAP